MEGEFVNGYITRSTNKRLAYPKIKYFFFIQKITIAKLIGHRLNINIDSKIGYIKI